MSARPEPPLSETLGQVVRDLRRSVGETQGAFADRFGYGRTHITEIENNRLSGQRLRPGLIEQFPHAAARITAAIDRIETRPKMARTVPGLRREVERLIKSGDLEAAWRALIPYFDHPRYSRHPQFSYKDHYWIHEQLRWVCSALGYDVAARLALYFAWEAAERGKMWRETVHCIILEARNNAVLGEFEYAHENLDEALAVSPEAPALWLQKGELLWLEQSYSGAYAALTTALRYRATRSDVLRLRAQVLAEWGNFDAALTDIDDYLACNSSTPLHICEVLSARAYALGMTNRPQEAKLAFTETEQRGGTHVGLLHYRRAQCYEHVGDLGDALAAYKLAVASDKPALDNSRKNNALERISVLEQTRQGMATNKTLLSVSLDV